MLIYFRNRNASVEKLFGPMREEEEAIIFDYLRKIVFSPREVIAWNIWWVENAELVKATLDRRDYLKLKYRKILAAREILARRGECKKDIHYRWMPEFDETHCRMCGELLFWATPHQTSPSEIREFARRIGRKDIESEAWIHPGVYCPNKCVSVMFNYGHPPDWDS